MLNWIKRVDWFNRRALADAHYFRGFVGADTFADWAAMTVVYEQRLDQIAAQETPSANATVKRMAAIARGEEPKPAKRKPVKRVEAGPVPEGATVQELRSSLHNLERLGHAFVFERSAQGHKYWVPFWKGKPLTPEARSIIETWIAELEAKAPERAA